MLRANRYFTEGHYYHLTHRCHDRDLLLRFARDGDAYRVKLRERAAAHRVSVLGYTITSNHLHVIAGARDRSGISAMMHDVAGGFARSYNRRRRRTNAFWGERYHATLFEGRVHLWRCMRYIDLNMVRTKAVAHPADWPWCGYQEIIGRRKRYRLIDQEALLEALDMGTNREAILRAYEEDVAHHLQQQRLRREWQWTEALAVGSPEFVARMKSTIKNRPNVELEEGQVSEGGWILRERNASYA